MTSDLDIFQAANLWAARHGDAAVLEARKMAAQFQAAGDLDGADVWLRIIVAVETLLAPRTGALS
jgi:hypothetical protein